MLILRQVQNQNRTIAKGWYYGKNNFYKIEFVKCNIEVLERDAFAAEPFRILRYFKIQDNDGIIQFHANCFERLSRMVQFNFYNSDINQSNVGILNGINKNLQQFLLKNCSTDIGFRNIFGKHDFLNLDRIFDDTCRVQQFKTFAPSNFTNLLALRSLVIYRASLEVILDGTFDRIANSLQELILEGNRLKVMVPDIFKAYIEYSHMLYRGIIATSKNHLECNCDLPFFSEHL